MSQSWFGRVRLLRDSCCSLGEAGAPVTQKAVESAMVCLALGTLGRAGPAEFKLGSAVFGAKCLGFLGRRGFGGMAGAFFPLTGSK